MLFFCYLQIHEWMVGWSCYLLVLINPPILPTQHHQPLKQLHSLLFHFASTHHLLLMPNPIPVIPLRHIIFRWPSMVLRHEGHYLIILCQPALVLRHTLQIIVILRPSLRHKNIRTKLPQVHQILFHSTFQVLLTVTITPRLFPSKGTCATEPTAHSKSIAPLNVNLQS